MYNKINLRLQSSSANVFLSLFAILFGIQQTLECDNGWTLLGDSCYWKLNQQNGITYFEAKTICFLMDSTLLNNSHQDISFLNRNLGESIVWMWSNEVIPADGNNKDYQSNEAVDICVTYSITRWMQNNNCSSLASCACKKKMEGNDIKSMDHRNNDILSDLRSLRERRAEEADINEEKNILDYPYCKNGWLRMGDRCIHKAIEAMSFDDAKQYCSSEHSNLISIHSSAEQATVNFLGGLNNDNMWTGLQCHIDEPRMYRHGNRHCVDCKWIDGSTFDDYNYWEQPIIHSIYLGYDYKIYREENNFCVESFLGGKLNGKWNNVSCKQNLLPVCSKRYDTADENVTKCCDDYKDFILENSICYYVVKEKKSWKDAQKHCASLGAQLLSITDYIQQSYVWYKSAVMKENIWIGLKSEEGKQFKWQNSLTAFYDNWEPGEPHTFNEDRCTAVHNITGKWFAEPCNSLKSFICQHNIEEVQSVQKCPTEKWNDYGGNFCYQYNSKKLSWGDASKWCHTEKGNLSSVSSSKENYILSSFTKDNSENAWIGLQYSKMSGMRWSDWTDLTYNPQLTALTDSDQCVSIDMYGNWKSTSCIFNLTFICKTMKVLYYVQTIKQHTDETSSMPSPTTEDISTKTTPVYVPTTERVFKMHTTTVAVPKPEKMDDTDNGNSSSYVGFIVIIILLLAIIGGLGYLSYPRMYDKMKMHMTKRDSKRVSLGDIETRIIGDNSSQ